MLGAGEIIVLVIVIVSIFSASRMGTLGNALGRFVYSFRKASRGQGFIDVSTQKRVDQTSKPDVEFDDVRRP